MIDFGLLRPWFLLLFLLPFFVRSVFSKKEDFEKIVRPDFWKIFRVSVSDFYRRGRFFLKLLTLVCFIVALSGPVLYRTSVTAFSDKKGAVIVWDTSYKNIAQKEQSVMIMDLLPSLSGVETGLVIYDEMPYLIAPLSEDHQMISMTLPQISPTVMPAGKSSDKARALSFAQKILERSGFSTGKIYLFDADGMQEEGSFVSSFKTEDGKKIYPVDFGIYFLMIGILLLILSELFGHLGFMVILACFTAVPAFAKYEKDWQGVDAYRAGEYDLSIDLFKAGEDEITSLYNLGNAYAFSGRISDAIKTYEAVLKKRPDHADAQFNLDYLKQQQNQGGGQSENNQDQNGQSNDQNDSKNASSSDDIQRETSDQTQEQNTQEGQVNPDSEDTEEQYYFVPAPGRDDQWLSQIPDEPLGLLRERLRRQYIKSKNEE